MTEAREHGFGWLRALAVVLLAFGAAHPSCASSTKEGSESHFQKCASDGECMGAHAVCSSGQCVTLPGYDASSASDVGPPGFPPGQRPDSAGLGGFSCNQAPNEHVVPLSELCGILAQDGLATCPTTRAAFIAAMGPLCIPAGAVFTPPALPSLERACGYDTIGYAVTSGSSVNFRFDAASGAFVGAAYLADAASGWPCGAGRYEGGNGALLDRCGNYHSCDLCVTGSCPSDVEEETSNVPCTSPDSGGVTDAGLCQCSEALPKSGTLCEGACPHCQSGTCWADCTCMRDGVRRYLAQCTE